MTNKFNNNRFKYYLINYIWNSLILYKYSLLRTRCIRDDDNHNVVHTLVVEVHRNDEVVHRNDAVVHRNDEVHTLVVRSTFLFNYFILFCFIY